jgi:hypothetical protein
MQLYGLQNKKMTFTVEEIKKMMGEITPGKWEIDALGYIRGEKGESILDRKENAPFVASAPEIVEFLLQRVEELEKKLLYQDQSLYGISIEQDGKRVDPKDFYKDEKDLKIEDLELRFQAARHVAARLIGGEFTPTLSFIDQQIEAEVERLKSERKD